MFQPEPLAIQQPTVVPLIEMQYDYYTPSKQLQTQQQIPATLPIYRVKIDYLPIIAIVGILGLFGFLAYLAYTKR